MNITTDTMVTGLQAAWAHILIFVPKLVLLLAIVFVGYHTCKWLARLVEAFLNRAGFDRLVEKSGIDGALAHSPYRASGILRKIVFFALFLFVLQLGFGVFDPNPVSDILTRVIAFLPVLFVAVLIIVVSSALAKMVKDIVSAVLGRLSYGRTLANLAGGSVLVVGVFAAISHLGIAPAIVNGLFYALLAIVAGSAIIAIGGGGILPMRRRWERALDKIEQEVPKFRIAGKQAASALQDTAETTEQNLETQSRLRAEQAARYQSRERSRSE